MTMMRIRVDACDAELWNCMESCRVKAQTPEDKAVTVSFWKALLGRAKIESIDTVLLYVANVRGGAVVRENGKNSVRHRCQARFPFADCV